ncbi:type VI secretion protein [Budviciaceae bacterium CWB-B4]|uniref:Type VI secretion protein n=1 Tax=Limnobaculum xujianqingii TaxID=2738837 RepID=A0A9D7AGG3_9GAMM|nr:type VI secretion system-associated protein TagO [Limnobaculum xujianqingii]MBK5072236.1 type VI secretion protein [Limnobaculum xujianqingii]MBK5175545.1 type VI secretion protein [Limnobaculum xujianqingii]
MNNRLIKCCLYAVTFICTAPSFVTHASTELIETSGLKCKGLSDKEQRLSCFDELFKDKELAPSPAINKGNWMITQKVSPIDDSKNVVISLYADRPIETKSNGKSMPLLTIRCAEKKTSFYVYWDTYLGSKSLEVTHRLDSDKALTERWDISTDNKAVFYSDWNGGAKAIIKQLNGKDKLFMQLTPYGSSPVSAIFYLNGMDNALKPVRDACGW